MNALFAGARSRWQMLAPRERAAIAAAGAVVALALGWVAVWQPLVHDLADTERELLQAKARIVKAQAQANDIASLARQAGPPATADVQAAVVRLLIANALRGSATSIDAQDGGTRVTFASVGLDALVPWLDALAREERLFPVEMTLTRRVEPGRLRAEITLAR